MVLHHRTPMPRGVSMVSFRVYGAVVLAGLLGASCGGSGFSGGLAPGSGDAGGDGSVDARANMGDATAIFGPDGTDSSDGALPAQDAGGANDGSPSAQDSSDAMLEAS